MSIDMPPSIGTDVGNCQPHTAGSDFRKIDGVSVEHYNHDWKAYPSTSSNVTK